MSGAMDHPAPNTSDDEPRSSRFELAPPRRFVLPAILLLLSEEPGHGYSLEKALREMNFGRVDRPAVYRALAHLEADGLVHASVEAPRAGHERRVYAVTPLGEKVLAAWMSVIKEERDVLGRVLRRYQATGTVDALLAEVQGGWAGSLGAGWSPVSATSVPPRHLSAVGAPSPPAAPVVRTTTAPARRYELVPDRSVVLIEARSSVGPISFGAVGLTGHVEAVLEGSAISATAGPSAEVAIEVGSLRSGNSLYDAELLNRIDARQFPTASVVLADCAPSGPDGRFRVTGALTFHGVTRTAEGTVHAVVDQAGRLVVRGEQVFDIRDFSVPSPTVLMLRIYPDIRVRLQVEAELVGA
ncbi:MAG: helix-turn-helix transcriptional regulator [Acidimicrobiales bacterium]